MRKAWIFNIVRDFVGEVKQGRRSISLPFAYPYKRINDIFIPIEKNDRENGTILKRVITNFSVSIIIFHTEVEINKIINCYNKIFWLSLHTK